MNVLIITPALRQAAINRRLAVEEYLNVMDFFELEEIEQRYAPRKARDIRARLLEGDDRLIEKLYLGEGLDEPAETEVVREHAI